MAAFGFIIAIFGLGLLIFVHECGHFFVGKLLRLKITEFFIGLPIGRPILQFTRGETTYGIKPVLFGGYIKFPEYLNLYEAVIDIVKPASPAERAGLRQGDLITAVDGAEVRDWLDVFNRLKALPGQTVTIAVRRGGQDLEFKTAVGEKDGVGWLGAGPAATDDIVIDELPRTMEGQKTWRKGLVIAAGPIMNILLAVALVTGAMMVGFQEPTTTIGRVVKGGPAEKAGIKPGDRIISLNGKNMPDWQTVTATIKRNAGRQIEVKVERGGRIYTFASRLRTKSTDGLLGIVTRLARRPRGLIEAAKEGFSFIYQASALILAFMARLVTSPGEVVGQLRSPIGVVSETAPIAQRDMMAYVMTLAGISIAIGIFNFLPLPPLDGGRIFISAVEFLMRRPMAKESLAFLNAAGLSLLLVLMTYVIAADIFRLAAPGG